MACKSLTLQAGIHEFESHHQAPSHGLNWFSSVTPLHSARGMRQSHITLWVFWGSCGVPIRESLSAGSDSPAADERNHQPDLIAETPRVAFKSASSAGALGKWHGALIASSGGGSTQYYRASFWSFSCTIVASLAANTGSSSTCGLAPTIAVVMITV